MFLPRPSHLTRSVLAAVAARAATAAPRAHCCMALVLALPLLTGRVPGSGSLQALIAPRQVGSPFTITADQAAQRTRLALAMAQPGESSEGLYRITPERRALLNTIRFAEGTWTGGLADGYRMIYGGRLVADLARHPEITVRGRYLSAAAGAYQFLPGTWREAAHSLGLKDFGPASQDQAALYLVEKRGALDRFDRRGLSPEVLARLAPEWASLPTPSGHSYYGQPVHHVGELQRFYSAELARLRAARAAAEALQA